MTMPVGADPVRGSGSVIESLELKRGGIDRRQASVRGPLSAFSAWLSSL
jgi:hypothetical protein